jgi:SAM-dependent methyltransferase
MADQTKLDALLGQIMGDLGAAGSSVLVIIGDRLGLYRALAEHGPCNSVELAAATGTAERYIREWLAAQAAAGYVTYGPAEGQYWLEPEQSAIFVDEGGPAFLAGAFESLGALFKNEPKLTKAFETGEGVGWGDHHPCLFRGMERLTRGTYESQLVDVWLPALDGIVAKLEAGARVADVGCGAGISSLVVARKFPNSRVVGFDAHEPSIERARKMAAAEGLQDRLSFECATAQGFPGADFDLVMIIDALHHMGDPVGAARRVRETLASDGVWLLVEPFANDRMEDNLNPLGRWFYSVSTMLCTPGALSQEGGYALGAQAGEARLRDVANKAGFTHFRRAAETPFNLVLEARP